MAPGYRANNQSRRANRSYVDHDIFEGLPVRNWRRETVPVLPPPVYEVSSQKDIWDLELPWGMPKDSHLLPQHSQDLLRIARSGRLYVKRPLVEEEEVDVEAGSGDKPEKKDDNSEEKGFMVKMWKPIARHLEGPEIEVLAKRRKGLIGAAVKTSVAAGPAVTKARVRRTDAAGNSYVEDVVMAEGQPLEGELLSQTSITNPVPGATVADGSPLQPRSHRRRPPPKRRGKGPGRGRKKKLPLPPTSAPRDPADAKVEPDDTAGGVQQNLMGPDGIKLEMAAPVNNENEIEDAEMNDDALLQSDEDGDDSDDDDHSESNGPGDQEDEDADQTKPEHLALAPVEASMDEDQGVDNGNAQEHERDSSSPDVPLVKIIPGSGHEHGVAGSPLRNVVSFPPPMFEAQSPDLESEGEAEADGDLDDVDHEEMHDNLQGGIEDQEMHTVYHVQQGVDMGMPSDGGLSYDLDFSAHKSLDGLSMNQTSSYSGDAGEMLLDGDMSGMDFGCAEEQEGHGHGLEQESFLEPFPDEDEEIMTIPVQESVQMHETHSPMHDTHPPMQDTHPLMQDTYSPIHETHSPIQETRSPFQEAHLSEELMLKTGREEEDNFEDLLGSLEDHLNEQEPEHDELGVEPVHSGEGGELDQSGQGGEPNNNGEDSVPSHSGEVVEPIAVPPTEQVEVVASEEVGEVDAIEDADIVPTVDAIIFPTVDDGIVPTADGGMAPTEDANIVSPGDNDIAPTADADIVTPVDSNDASMVTLDVDNEQSAG